MTVKYIRPEVKGFMNVWNLINLCLSGPTAVKKAGDTLLPRPNAADTSKENKARYDAYLLRAVFYAVAARTHKGLIGQVFYRDPVIELPALLKSIIVSADGGEMTLEQQSKEATSLTLSLGHAGLLVDYPKTEAAATRAQQRAGAIRPNILLYRPEKIINWRISSIGTSRYLSLLVLLEEYEDSSDEFEIKTKNQYRVLTIQDGILRVRVVREQDGAEKVISDEYPKMGNGKSWTEIPFAFMGSVNNEAMPDDPPMEDLCHLNVAHYRNSADYEEACFIVGQPTPWAAGLTEDWVKDVWEGDTILLGSRAFLPLPVNGSAGLLQVAPNSMTYEAMEQKEKQMVALGARLVEQQAIQRTATEASIESITDNSVLATVAKNVSAAYLKALQYAATFSNVSGKITFELNTDFEINKLTAQERQQLLTEWQGSGITWEEYRWNLKRSGVAFEDDAKAKVKIEADSSDDLALGQVNNTVVE